MKHFIGHDEYEEVFDQFRDVGLYDGMVTAMDAHTGAITPEEALELNIYLSYERKKELLTRMDGEDMTTTRGKDDDEENGNDAARKARGHSKEDSRSKGTDQ